MKALARLMRVGIGWIHERLIDKPYSIGYIDTNLQAVDIYTKGFTDPNKWISLVNLVGVYDPEDEEALPFLSLIH